MSASSGLLLPSDPRRPSSGDDPPASSIGDGGGGGGSRWVALVKASNDIEAHLLMGRLGEAGVESRTLKDKGAPGAWLYGGSNPWAPVTVMVRSRQLEDARLVLAEVSFEAPDEAPPAEREWRVPVLWWATALVLGVLFTGMALAQAATSYGACQIPIFCNER